MLLCHKTWITIIQIQILHHQLQKHFYILCSLLNTFDYFEYEHLLLVSHRLVLGHRSRLVHGVDLAHPVGLRTLARQPDVLTEICWEVEGEMVDRREGDGLDFVLQGLS